VSYAKYREVDRTILGLKLREVRKENKTTQKELAKILGFNRCTIQKYETGKFPVKIEYLVRFCNLYQVEMDTVIGRYYEIPGLD